MANYSSDMPWQDLISARYRESKNPEMQAKLAPMEHQAYAREAVSKNPLLAIAYPGMEAGYQLMKATGLMDKIAGTDEMTTPASLDQLIATWNGTKEGLSEFLKSLYHTSKTLPNNNQVASNEQVVSPFYQDPFPDTTK